ncbi:DUF1674 domain-containing protein [uncultured Cohaesibacter sp.]|uniref:DUF1674 domain-containing protein n=1 Tax=uncultured Cohaesibacter sp. TaxID=1002546 RepID=UPI00292F70F6|nr:DUF1674 domain-containing protein [uncultured Cohaesibacter sp.]
MTEETPNRQFVDINSPEFKTETVREQSTEEEKPKAPRRKFEDLPPAAQRALLEAEDRRKERDALKISQNRPKEYSGRGGLDPSRYEDYEINGRAIDF